MRQPPHPSNKGRQGRTPPPVAWLVLSTLTLGCQSNAPETEETFTVSTFTDVPPPTRPTVTEPIFDPPASAFWVELGNEQLTVYGAFRDRGDVELHTEVGRQGNCRLLKNEPSQCEPECVNGQSICVDSTCESFPRSVDRGEMSITWSEGTETFSPSSNRQYFLATPATVAPGDFTLTAAGNEVTGSFLLDAIELPYAGHTIETRANGEDVVLRWPNPIANGRVYLRMEDCTGSHGGISDFEIECEGPDTGELVIPASYLTFLEQGNWSRGNCGVHPLNRTTTEVRGEVSVISIAPSSIYYFPLSGSHPAPP